MSGKWQLQEAKNRLSKVVDDAIQRGPQVITRHGVEVAVVLSLEEYRRLASSQEKFTKFICSSPLADIDLDLRREVSPVREDFAL